MFRSTVGLLFAVSCLPAFSQGHATGPSFEAAAVKANQSGETRMAVDFQAGGRFSATNVPLKTLIALAYHIRPEAVSGGPAWLGSSRFDIVAKALQITPPEEIARMLQTLLAERFKLEVRSDQKMMPAYALLAGKPGTRLQPSEAALLTDQRCRSASASAGQKHAVCEHMTMALFAKALQELAPRDLDAPVVDQTGMEGTYTFDVEWRPAVRTATVAASPDAFEGPTLFEAVQAQLGLKLESKKLLLPVIAVEHVELLPPEER